jgi:hypothetical protein
MQLKVEHYTTRAHNTVSFRACLDLTTFSTKSTCLSHA